MSKLVIERLSAQFGERILETSESGRADRPPLAPLPGAGVLRLCSQPTLALPRGVGPRSDRDQRRRRPSVDVVGTH